MEFKNEIYGSWSASKVKDRVVLSIKPLRSEKEIVTIRKKNGNERSRTGQAKNEDITQKSCIMFLRKCLK